MHSPDTARRTLSRVKILLIEDNPDHQRLIQFVLQSGMPQVELLTAATGEEAFNQLTACTNRHWPLPHLILLDCYLPRREDGWTLLQQLKGPTSPYRLIPLTLLSQSAKPDDIQTAYRLGANAYTVKPTNYPHWQAYCRSLGQYWLHTVTLPPVP